MTDRVHYHANLIFSVGTQVVTLVDIASAAGLILHPRGTVGVIVKSLPDLRHFLTGLRAMPRGSRDWSPVGFRIVVEVGPD
jgi:hypothetical protein